MKVESVSIDWDGGTVSGRLIRGEKRPGVLLAHGAGTDQDHPMMVGLRDGIGALGYPVMTFNYAYTERGSKRPDPQERLLSVHRAALAWFKDNVAERVALMGRSMGGRMGTYLAAEGADVEGVVLHSYPLHPAGKPEKLRKDHLPGITVPMLFLVGTRDPLSQMALFDRWVRPLPTTETFEVPDGDHSMRVRKASGRTNEQVQEEIMARLAEWLAARQPN
ncbi:MAG: dienelactone hydrolase family protein [Acidimicrobiia bacterium]|nr:dienelactone hydrolase family protein [Acidimicrobiia bacterium]